MINVGATHKNDKLYRYSTGGSNFGDCVSLYAPGQSVFAADEDHGYRYVAKSTSHKNITCNNIILLCTCVLLLLLIGLILILQMRSMQACVRFQCILKLQATANSFVIMYIHTCTCMYATKTATYIANYK